MKAKKVLIIIPARYNSNRLPGKVLEDLHGFPMIYWVYRRAAMSHCGPVIVAADHPKVFKALENLCIPYVKSSPSCRNGTERIHEVSKYHSDIDYFINVQGDEPLLNPRIIQEVLAGAQDNAFNTAVSEIKGNLNNPNEIKVALSFNNRIRYASRSAVNSCASEAYKIHGVYLYSRSILKAFVEAPFGPLELLESIEQLRCLENDIPLYGVKTSHTERSVDTYEDLIFMRNQPRELFI